MIENVERSMQLKPVIPDLDIYRTANVLVKQHGEDAPFRCRYAGGRVA